MRKPPTKAERRERFLRRLESGDRPPWVPTPTDAPGRRGRPQETHPDVLLLADHEATIVAEQARAEGKNKDEQNQAALAAARKIREEFGSASLSAEECDELLSLLSGERLTNRERAARMSRYVAKLRKRQGAKKWRGSRDQAKDDDSTRKWLAKFRDKYGGTLDYHESFGGFLEEQITWIAQQYVPIRLKSVKYPPAYDPEKGTAGSLMAQYRLVTSSEHNATVVRYHHSFLEVLRTVVRKVKNDAIKLPPEAKKLFLDSASEVCKKLPTASR